MPFPLMYVQGHMSTRVLGIAQLLLAAGRADRGEEPLGGTATVVPRCSDDDDDVTVGSAAPSRVARLQERNSLFIVLESN